MTDIEIAQASKMLPIEEVAAKVGIKPEQLENYGHYKAKVDIHALKDLPRKSKLVLVTAISPTPAGEGKTTTSVGLADALNKLGKNTMVCLREPSLGPVFGVKGGAAGGGYAQVVPMEDINLHFTGDFHAIGAANNLLAAMLDNHIQQGNALNIDPRRIVWKRAVDMNDRQLRHIIDGLGGKASGAPGGRFGGITVGNLMGLLSPTSLFQNTVSGGSGLWSNRSNILKSAKMGAWMANSSGQGGIAGRLSSLAGGVIGALNSDALTSGKKKPMQAVAGKIFGAAGYINNVANIPTNAMNAMIAAANPAGTATATIGNVLGAGAKAVFGKGGLNLTGGIGTVAGKLGGGFMSLLGTFGPAITSLGTMVAVVSLLGDHFEDVRTIIGQIFGEGGLAVFDAFTGKLSGIGDTIKQVFGQLTTPEGLQSIQEKLSNFSIGGLNLGDVFGAAMPAIQTVMPLIQSFAGVFGQIVDLGVNHIKPLLVEIFGFVVNQGIPAVMPLLSTVVSLVGTILVNAIKTVVDVIGKLLPVVEPVVLGIIGLVKGIVGVVVNVVNAIIRTLNKINFTVPDWVPALGGKQFGFNLTEVTLPKFADGGFTSGPSLAGEAGTEAIISFRRSQREQNVDTWLQAGKMLGVPLASAMIQGSDFGVAFRRTTELANYAADALEGAAASGNATAQKVLDNSRVQQALSFARRADVAQAQLERLSDLDGYDLSNLTFFPTAGDAALTRQNLAMLENLRDHQQEVEVPSITGDNGTNSGSGQPGGTGGYQRSYTSSSGNTYVYAPNFIIYGSMDANDLRSLLDEGYEKFCEYVERYEREKRRTQYGT